MPGPHYDEDVSALTPSQQYQITECVRELLHGATPDELAAKGYAAGAIEEANRRVNG